jgi:DNA-directed RNA polymerase subunit K/omega
MAKTKRSNAAQKKHLVPQGELKVDDTLQDMLHDHNNKYLLVNLIARRGRELNRGERSLADLPPPHTFTQLAHAEMQQDKLVLKRKETSKIVVNLIETE